MPSGMAIGDRVAVGNSAGTGEAENGHRMHLPALCRRCMRWPRDSRPLPIAGGVGRE